MASVLRLYRATVLSTADPQGQGRVQLSLVRTVRGVSISDEGWATAGASPLGISVGVRPLYGAGDVVIYAAQRLPFVGAVVLFREVNNTAPAASQALSLHLALGQGNEVTIDAGMVKVSGVIQCETLVANAVVATSYTPGAGNLQ